MEAEMNQRAGRGIAAALVLLGLTSCNYDVGPCYRREDIEGAGAGGGPIGPGWGGYGEAPSEPQDATDPPPVECGGSSCSYDPDEDTCGPSPANLEECYEDCAYQHGRDMEACSRKKDPKKRPACYEKANRKNADCRHDCEKKFPPKK